MDPATTGTSIAALLLLATFISKFMDFLKFARARDTNGVLTQVIAWSAGVIGVFLFAETDFARGVSLGGVALAEASGATKVFAGLMAISLLSKVYDFQKSFDNTQTSATPSIVPGTGIVNTTTGHAAATTATPPTTPAPATPAPHPTT